MPDFDSKTQFVDRFVSENALDTEFRSTALSWFIPLGDKIALHHNSASKPFFVGVNGCQGCGKSTLTDFLSRYLSAFYNKNVVNLSLDDFYLSKSQRVALSIKVHPLLATRGVPGTHDTEFMRSSFEQLAQQHGQVTVPKFNKAEDDLFPKQQWQSATLPVDVVIFEGWCWGVQAQQPYELEAAVNTLEENYDASCVWRRFVNKRLVTDYQPLYAFMDYWLMLKAPNFDCVYQWRLQQEQKLREKLLAKGCATQESKGLMSAAQIQDFIQYYQRLTEHSLSSDIKNWDLVFELDEHRKILNATGLS